VKFLNKCNTVVLLRGGTTLPGVVGLIKKNGDLVSIASSLEKLAHFDSYFSKEARINSHMVVGQVWRTKKQAEEDWMIDIRRGVAVLVNGTVLLDSHVQKKLTAQDIAESYLRKREINPNIYEGSFVITIVDQKRDIALICNDRLGSLPLYYGLEEDTFCFAPEVKAVLSALDVNAKLSKEGVITFLVCGYCLGETTLFKRVKMLEPGCILSIQLSCLSITISHYWKIYFEPNKRLMRRKYAEMELYEAIVHAHKLILCDVECGFDLLLSGGMDSRGNLAILEKIGQRPDRVFGWGVRKDIPFSDSYLAAELAKEFGVRYDFIKYDTDEFVENAKNWSYISELANDNIGWYAEGASILTNYYNTDADFTLVGDECWGWGGSVHTEEEAIDEVISAKLPRPLERSIFPRLRSEFRDIYRNEIVKVMRKCENLNWIDRKDYLYLHGRVARFIFSIGYYKELAVELRRPFLAHNVIKVVSRLPANYRIWKNLYLSMLSRYLPRAMSVPNSVVSSLPDWLYDIRAKLPVREYFYNLLDSEKVTAGILAGIVDPIELNKIKEEFLNGKPVPLTRKPVKNLRQLANWMPPGPKERLMRAKRKFAMRRSNTYDTPQDVFDLLRRVALLALIESQLSRFSS
jgi:hypothetical protein